MLANSSGTWSDLPTQGTLRQSQPYTSHSLSVPCSAATDDDKQGLHKTIGPQWKHQPNPACTVGPM